MDIYMDVFDALLEFVRLSKILNDPLLCIFSPGVNRTTYWSYGNDTTLAAFGGEICREKHFLRRQNKTSYSTSINFITVVSRLSHSRDAFRLSPATKYTRAKRSMSNY